MSELCKKCKPAFWELFFDFLRDMLDEPAVMAFMVVFGVPLLFGLGYFILALAGKLP